MIGGRQKQAWFQERLTEAVINLCRQGNMCNSKAKVEGTICVVCDDSDIIVAHITESFFGNLGNERQQSVHYNTFIDGKSNGGLMDGRNRFARPHSDPGSPRVRNYMQNEESSCEQGNGTNDRVKLLRNTQQSTSTEIMQVSSKVNISDRSIYHEDGAFSSEIRPGSHNLIGQLNQQDLNDQNALNLTSFPFQTERPTTTSYTRNRPDVEIPSPPQSNSNVCQQRASPYQESPMTQGFKYRQDNPHRYFRSQGAGLAPRTMVPLAMYTRVQSLSISPRKNQTNGVSAHKCPYCETAFPTSSKLWKHIRNENCMSKSINNDGKIRTKDNYQDSIDTNNNKLNSLHQPVDLQQESTDTEDMAERSTGRDEIDLIDPTNVASNTSHLVREDSCTDADGSCTKSISDVQFIKTEIEDGICEKTMLNNSDSTQFVHNYVRHDANGEISSVIEQNSNRDKFQPSNKKTKLPQRYLQLKKKHFGEILKKMHPAINRQHLLKQLRERRRNSNATEDALRS